MKERPVSRRTILKLSGLTTLAVSTGAVSLFGAAGRAAAVGETGFTWPVGGTGTTLDETIGKGAPDANNGGYMKLQANPGEGYTVHSGLGAATFDVAYAIKAFAQMTDLHIVDDQSPLRTEWLDRDTDSTHDFRSAYRPHEFMSTHVVDAMARAIRKIGRGPRTGLPLAFTIVTGDAVDNAQHNETRWYIDLLDGGQSIRPDSGAAGVDESVSNVFGNEAPGVHDPNYWSPDGANDVYHLTYGFGRYPSLLTNARMTYRSTGLGMPWYAAIGNHDVEVQGNLPTYPDGLAGCILPDFNSIVVSASKPWNSTYTMPGSPGVFDVVDLWDGAETHPITADSSRRLLAPFDFVAEHRDTNGTPLGHGFAINPADPTQDETFYIIDDDPLIRFIVLDSTNDQGNSDGRIDDFQWQWLVQQLQAVSTYFYDPVGNPVATGSPANKLIVVCCHHTLGTMDNSTGDPRGEIGPRGTKLAGFHYGDELRTLLLRFPNVILMVDGHTHRNTISAHARTEIDTSLTGGFWEVSTASHIDWPIQSRLFEIAVSATQLVIYTTILDIDADTGYNGDPVSQKSIAALARELAANDPQEGRTQGREGATSDRNAELWLPAPFPFLNLFKSVGAGPYYADAAGTLRSSSFGLPAVDNGAAVLAPNTSPSVAVGTDGTWRIAYTNSSGLLAWVSDANQSTAFPVKPTAGTSPSIARLRTGDYVMAAADSNQNTVTMVGPNGVVQPFYVMMSPGSSPAVAATPAAPGSAYLIAFQHIGVTATSPGELYAFDDQGVLRTFGGRYFLAAGTSPSIAAFPTGGYLIAIHGSDGNLWTVDENGVGKNLNVALAPGSSPGISVSMQGWVIVYQGADGQIHYFAPGFQNGLPQPVIVPPVAGGASPVAPGTNPVALPGGFEREIKIWWHHADGTIWFFEPQNGARSLNAPAGPGCSPTVFWNTGLGANPAAIAPQPATQRTTIGDYTGWDERFAIQAIQDDYHLVIGDITLSKPGPLTNPVIVGQNPPPGAATIIPGVTTFDFTIGGS